jgi:hypothetical protein
VSQRVLSPGRRLVITVCPQEPGAVVLAVERGQPRRRLTARRILDELQALVDRRGLSDVVRVREGCAGGCHGRGPNVSLTVHTLPLPGKRPDNVAIGWHTYVGSIGALDCLAAILEAHLHTPDEFAGGACPPERRSDARS